MKPSMIALAKKYLIHRRTFGAHPWDRASQILQFARWADQSGHVGPLTIDLALRWAAASKVCSPRNRARRLELVRGFARYCSIFDPRTEIPPTRLVGAGYRRITPYIYSQQQIAELLGAARKLPPRDGLWPRTVYTVLGLLACTGLRISEAVKLDRDDVEIPQGLVTIIQSKCRKSRLLPLHPTAAEALRQYAQFRDRYHPSMSSDAFFLSESGKRATACTVRARSNHLCRRLRFPAGPSGRKPRRHDLRHTFVCRRVLEWYREETDVEHGMASLSTYLGHRLVTHTYWYLTGIPDLMTVAARRLERFVRQGGVR